MPELASRGNIAERIRELELQPGAKVEVVLREGVNISQDGGSPQFIFKSGNQTTEAPGESRLGYLCNYVSQHTDYWKALNYIRLALGWNKGAAGGSMEVCESAVHEAYLLTDSGKTKIWPPEAPEKK